MTNQNQGIGNEIYNDAYKLSLFTSNLFYNGAIIFCALLVIASIYIKYKSYQYNNEWVDTEATVTNANCYVTGGYQNQYTKCNLDVKYKNMGKTYDNKITTNGHYIDGDGVKISLDKKNPKNISTTTMEMYNWYPIIILIVCLVVYGLSYWNKYMTENYKIYGVVNLASGIFGRRY
jgi:hypothetical protein